MPSNEQYLKAVGDYTKQLEKLSGEEVVVGIPGSKNKQHLSEDKQRKVTTLAEVGAIHEFGVLERGIPQRSFLRAPLQKEGKKLIALISKDLKFSTIDTTKALGRLGALGTSIVIEAFNTQDGGTWAKLKVRKGVPLRDTGQLIQGITFEVRKKGKE